MRLRLLALTCLLTLGCADSEIDSSDSTGTTAAAPSTAATAPAAETTTSAAPSTTSTDDPASLVDTLEDGRPATFIGVTTDYEAVEASTETGAVVRSFGSRATATELELEGEIAANAVDGVWRTADGRHILISECCEPAAGRINVIPPEGILSSDYDDLVAEAWAALPSPADSKVLLVGYFTSLIEPQAGTDADCESFVRGACWTGETILENDGSGIAAIGWNHDGVRVHWYDPASANLLTWDSARNQLFRAPLTWVDDDQALVGLTGQASGNVVSFLHSYHSNGGVAETEGVVYSPESGGLVASFEVPTGSVLGGYEASGTFLIYTTPAGTVEFQGRGRTDQLGQGFYFASW